MRRTYCSLAIAMTLGLGFVEALPPAQSPATPQQDDSTFTSESDLVVLQVTVLDRHAEAVPNLAREAFHIIENGVPQTVTFFNGEDVPVAVGLALDNSSSMLTRRGMVMAGMQAFADSSRADDEAFTIVFNEHVRRGLPDSVAFTHSAPLLQSALVRFPAGGKTAFYDAVIAGLDHLDTSDRQKRVLVVLSDGEDNASLQTEAAMLKRAQRSDAIIYVVSTARLDANVGDERLLRKLARVTGGIAYTPKNEAAVVAAFGDIADNVRRGYTLGYVPTNGLHDGSYRRLLVQVRAPGLKTPVLRARDGYLSPLHEHGR